MTIEEETLKTPGGTSGKFVVGVAERVERTAEKRKSRRIIMTE
jgi:hypothetical protein